MAKHLKTSQEEKLFGAIYIFDIKALGLILGLHEDIKDKALERKIAEINAKFSTLKTQ